MTHFKYLSLSGFFFLAFANYSFSQDTIKRYSIISAPSDSIHTLIHPPIPNYTIGLPVKIRPFTRLKGDTSEMPLIVIDKWAIITPAFIGTIKLLNPKNISDIKVYNKDDPLTKSYGSKAKYGLIIIKLKQNTKLITLQDLFSKFHISITDQKLIVCIDKILVEYPDKILADPSVALKVEIILDKYWVYTEETKSAEKYININLIEASK